jgi:5,5'-dehydrodivanillate O-demethylase
MTPNDDHTTTRFIIYAIASQGDEKDREFTETFVKCRDYNPADHHDELINQGIIPEDELVELTSAQDYVAAVGQGAIADRRNEFLGYSDKGIIFLRKIMWRELEKISKGEPTKQWRKLAEDVKLPTQAPINA